MIEFKKLHTLRFTQSQPRCSVVAKKPGSNFVEFLAVTANLPHQLASPALLKCRASGRSTQHYRARPIDAAEWQSVSSASPCPETFSHRAAFQLISDKTDPQLSLGWFYLIGTGVLNAIRPASVMR